MTEQEWLASSDPAAMLRWLQTEPKKFAHDFRLSGRILRLFACACWFRGPAEGASEYSRESWLKIYDDPERGFQSNSPASRPLQLVEAALGFGGASPTEKANLLRCIIGNPWRPVTLDPRWLTPDALAIARKAYDERHDDGTLDPVTLCVLADALTDAGCGVGMVHEYNDGGTAYWWNDSFPDECHLTPDRAAIHPILAHLRSPRPHVRGCHALDTILAKE